MKEHTTDVWRIKGAAYVAQCSECGIIATSQTQRFLMVERCKEHDRWWELQKHVWELCDHVGIASRLRLKISNKKARNFGRARLLENTIELNGRLGKSQTEDTIRHEIAHFMDWFRNGNADHGPAWKECCAEIGAKPNQYTHVEEDEAASYGVRYVYTCPKGCKHLSYKRNKRLDSGNLICRQHKERWTATLVADSNRR